MHNIDRTVGESSYELNPEYTGEYGHELTGEFGFEREDEFLNELAGSQELPGESQEFPGEFQELTGEFQELPGETYETMGEVPGEVNQEALEVELATELLGVSNEVQLEQFLGNLIKKAAGAVRTFANSSAGRAVGGFLKSAAKKALPIVGQAAGTFFGGPLGGAIGGKLGSLATNLFEVELEGLSNEDKEFELSKAYVRFATDAVRRAAFNPRFRSNPRLVARNAIIAAARRNAPGLLRRFPRPRPVPTGYATYDGYGAAPSQGNSGTWYRQGNQIILNL